MAKAKLIINIVGMNDKKNGQFPVAYLLGGVAAIFFVAVFFLFIASLSSSGGKKPEILEPIFLLCIPGFYLVLRRFSKYLALGFVGVGLALLMFVLIFLIDLIIHPPSEE